jgi:hypothetical protein
VFRINATFNALFPKCNFTPDLCPSLDAEVAP